MIEIIIGACVSLLTQGIKWIVDRYGYEITKSAILVLVFVLSIIGASLYEWQFITQEMVETSLRTGAMAIAIYEVIYKRILEKFLTELKRVL